MWLSLAAANPKVQGNEQTNATQQRTPTPPAPAATPDYRPYPDKNADACYGANNHDAADLCAQWRAAIAAEKTAKSASDANWWAMVAAILGLLSIAGLLLALRQGHLSIEKANAAIAQASRQSKAAEDALDHQRTASYRQLRAYLSIGIPTFERLEDGRLCAYFPILNTGQTPATKVVIKTFVEFLPLPFHQVDMGKFTPHDARIQDIGPHAKRAHRYLHTQYATDRASFESQSSGFYYSIQLTYTTYTGEHIVEAPTQWMGRATELIEKTLSVVAEGH